MSRITITTILFLVISIPPFCQGNSQTNYDSVAALLSPLKKVNDFYELIPYHAKGKWGWMNERTRKAITKPILDYTDFPTAGGLPFGYKGQNLVYTPEKKVESLPSELAVGIDFGDALPTRVPTQSGFTVNGRRITSYSDKFLYVELANPWASAADFLGVAATPQQTSGVIRPNGDTLKGFAFNFSAIVGVRTWENQLYFRAMKPGDDFWMLYNLEGENIFSGKIQEESRFGLYQIPDWDAEIYIGSRGYDYTRVMIDNKWYVLNAITMKTVNQRGYDRISFMNGPTNHVNKNGSVDSPGIFKPYFMVTAGKEIFYIDEKGEEYRVK